MSNFGFTGALAHVILREPTQRAARAPTCERPLHLLALSAKSPEALQARVEALRRHVQEPDAVDFKDLAFTANRGRAHFNYRTTFIASDNESFRQKAAEPPVLARIVEANPRVAFLFTGQGALKTGAGYDLYCEQPVFQRALDRCAAILDPLLETPLTHILFEPSARNARAMSRPMPLDEPVIRAVLVWVDISYLLL